jgi:hypothetical protein
MDSKVSDSDKNAFPLPQPTGFTQPFWDACQNRELMAFACAQCGHLFLPGGPNCPKCWSTDLATKPVSGDGQVFSFVVYRHTYHPAIPAPYVVALIELKEGPRLVSNVVGCRPEDVTIGMPVRVEFQVEDGFVLPRFSPLATTNTGEE